MFNELQSEEEILLVC